MHLGAPQAKNTTVFSVCAKESSGTNAQRASTVSERQTCFFFYVLLTTEISRCQSAPLDFDNTKVRVCMCVHTCVGVGGVVFTLISHKRKTVVCILNTPIPWSVFPSRLLSPCSWCTHYCWKWCSNTTKRRVGVDRKKGEKQRRREGKKKKKKASCWYLFSPAAASGSFPSLIFL